jgi:4-aminobutyrate aminotransferase-like enzyme
VETGEHATGPQAFDAFGDGVWDADSMRYLDFESGQVCTSTGHCHPACTQAIIDQTRTLVQIGSGYTSLARVLLARKLAEVMPGELECSHFACTGSEATEVALRLTKLDTGGAEIVPLVRGYHSMTHASLSVTGLGGRFKAVPGTGLPATIPIPAPYAYRSPYPDRPDGDLAFFRHGLEIINWTSR